MTDFQNCQMPDLTRIATALALPEPAPFPKQLKRLLARPWNYRVKPFLRHHPRIARLLPLGRAHRSSSSSYVPASAPPLQLGDWVRVRSKAEIEDTINQWSELKGCAFLREMWSYCGTTQQVRKRVERFLDERDYQVKKSRGIVLLENITCEGTPTFGRCDRSCYLFWREEWLEKLETPLPIPEAE